MGYINKFDYSYKNTSHSNFSQKLYDFSTPNYGYYSSASYDFSFNRAEANSYTPTYSNYTSFSSNPYTPTYSSYASYLSSSYTPSYSSPTHYTSLKNTPLFNYSYNPINYTYSSYKYNNTYDNIYKFDITTNSTNTNTTRFKYNRSNTGSLQFDLAENAFYYKGKVNSDQEGNKLFSKGVRQHWCADFVTYVTKQTFGNRLPSDFGSSAVAGLRDWADKESCYLKLPQNNRKDFIKENVHVGDIMIEKSAGASHTGIVREVAPDGSWFRVVAGNSGNKVNIEKHYANSPRLSGFISLDKYCA